MARIQIIVGSVMGTALEVGQVLEDTLSGLGHNVTLNSRFQAGQLTQDPEEIILLCTSNTGMGDLPANIAPLLIHLCNDCPPIGGRRYGLVNLADSSYPNFAQAGQTLDDAMADLGAQRLGEPLVLDANYLIDPADEAAAWVLQWEQKI